MYIELVRIIRLFFAMFSLVRFSVHRKLSVAGNHSTILWPDHSFQRAWPVKAHMVRTGYGSLSLLGLWGLLTFTISPVCMILPTPMELTGYQAACFLIHRFMLSAVNCSFQLEFIQRKINVKPFFPWGTAFNLHAPFVGFYRNGVVFWNVPRHLASRGARFQIYSNQGITIPRIMGIMVLRLALQKT